MSSYLRKMLNKKLEKANVENNENISIHCYILAMVTIIIR